MARGTVPDPANRDQIDVEVVVFATADPGQRRRVLSLGEAKWGTTLGMRHLDRLRRARDLLHVRGFDTRDTVLTCYSGEDFDDELRDAAAAGETMLIDLDQIYGQP